MRNKNDIELVCSILENLFGIERSRLIDFVNNCKSQKEFDNKFNSIKEDAKKVYLDKVKQLHPDIHPEHLDKCKELNQCWTVVKESNFILKRRQPTVTQMQYNIFHGFSNTSTSTTTSTVSSFYGSTIKIRIF